MDAPLQPTPDDINLFVVAGQRWWQWMITGGLALIFGVIWRASSQWNDTRRDVRDHGDRLGKAEAAIGALKSARADLALKTDGLPARVAALETGQAAIALKLESLPTRSELAAQAARVDERFDRLDGRLDKLADPRGS